MCLNTIRYKLALWGFKWEKFNSYLTNKASGLLTHESNLHKKNSKHPSKDFIYAGFDQSKGTLIFDRGRVFLVASSDVFKSIMHRDIIEAQGKYPENFGKRNANLVINALYDVAKEGGREDFAEFLRNETHAYVVEIKRGKIVDKLLRIDLFRKIEQNKQNGDMDFTGGVLHVFKHYTYKGVPLSTYNEKFEIAHPSSIVRILIDGFFFQKLEAVERGGKGKLISEVKLSDDRFLKFVFYFEEKNGFYFIDSVSKRTI